MTPAAAEPMASAALQDGGAGVAVACVRSWQQVLAARGHRGMVLVAGPRDWCRECAGDLLQALPAPADQWLWLGAGAPAGVTVLPASAAERVLGSEQVGVVFDGWQGLNPDAVGALSGTIRAGGLLLLLMPVPAVWGEFDDPFKRLLTVAGHAPGEVGSRWLGRLRRCLKDDDSVLWVEPAGITGGSLPAVATKVPAGPVSNPDCLTEDQARAVHAVIRACQGQRRKPTVLVSDRGRGKSAALGIAAARLLQAGVRRIAVTGPRPRSVQTLLDHAQQLLPGSRRVGVGVLEFAESVIAYSPPDQLSATGFAPDMVLVDEAATIPVALLEGLLERGSRLAFATTVHGYEGSGRGFELRFGPALARNARGIRHVNLRQPVRWAADDPLERFIDRALLLDACRQNPALPQLDVADLRETCVDRAALADDDGLLDALWGLLVSSHYRTRPRDLRVLLDAPNISIFVSQIGKHVAAAAVVAREGGFAPQMAAQIAAGKRRPPGHLLPESIGHQLGMADAPQMSFGRIVRIAVQPGLRRRGIGRRLLDAVAAQQAAAGCDCLGTVFGASAALVHFWRAVQYESARLGVRRGARSGAHALLMLHGLSAPGRELSKRCQRRFARELPDQLADPLRSVTPRVVLALLAGLPQPKLSADQSRERVKAFASGQAEYEDAVAAIVALTPLALSEAAGRLSEAVRQALVLKVLQRRSWADCAAALGVSGRREVVTLLRTGLSQLD